MIHLPFDMGYLTEEMKERAERELGETEEIRNEALAEIRRIVREEPKLVCHMDDALLLQYLRARKFDIKRTWALLLNYYHVKKSYTEVYGTPDLEGFRETLRNKLISVLPYRDQDGCAIFVVKLDKWNLHKRKFASVVHDLTIAVMYCVIDPATQVCGIKIIADVSGLSFNHLQFMHPKYIHLIAKGMKSCLPARFKGLHIVNESSYFQYFWNVFRLVLTEKLRKRVYFHCTNMESLLLQFPREVVPVEYGGEWVIDNEPLIDHVNSMQHVYYERMSAGYRSKRSSQGISACPKEVMIE